ncbi:putative GNAT family N-acyltransferase [Natronospira proteinivora]|uniref:GNAT family N-acyltransferase n=1 Tax=Natronospira proteinivora TaxID=1807133 RepID=A0ABT1G6S5_9GAMM|nr:GNAT family N-acetyltransferase [Natronospira proteinivora]MCP1726792.1 putative GNAT family N-acyltransferase [Natronospira proteinivora]
MNKQFTVRPAQWPDDVPALREVREPVFVEEQQVPLALEWDEDDPKCIHVLAHDGEGRPIGTGRLSRDGKVGRMAVLKPWRGHGVGGAILQALLDEARKAGIPECRLHGQTSALGFYNRYGFKAEGEEFMEAGIPHYLMRLRISEDAS